MGGPPPRTGWRRAFELAATQCRSPLVAILAVGAALALFTGSPGDAGLVLLILLATGGLSVWQEWRADDAMARLRQHLAPTARVWRDGRLQELPAMQLVPGDLIALRAGDCVAADAELVEANNLLMVEATLTGESMPAEKWPAPSGTREVWTGTSVRSGTATARVTHTGTHTRMASLAQPLARGHRPSAFMRGIADFGALLMRLLLLIVVLALVGQVVAQRPLMEGLMLAMALAVGLSPEMLPVIVSVTLAQGAQRLSAGGMLLRRLDAMEDLGSLGVLCTDKTGTLTTGEMTVRQAEDAQGRASDGVLRLAVCNAMLEAGMANPLDAALVAEGRRRGWFSPGDPQGGLPEKVGEIPYDFRRRRLTILVRTGPPPQAVELITKGAVVEVLTCCTGLRGADGTVQTLEPAARDAIVQRLEALSQGGLRVLAVATKAAPGTHDHQALESGMVFEGLLAFDDPPDPQARSTLQECAQRGITVKMLTGDNRHVARAVAQAVGLPQARVVTGSELQDMRDEALWHCVSHTSVFAEIEPQHKERIVRALQRHGRVVGFLGDGINDAPALTAADVGISVQGAADVARECADLVLLRASLAHVVQAVDEGRRSFANTRRYVAITASANLGNMVSMALSGWVLPFPPMTAHQILLNNLLSDLPALTLPQEPLSATDRAHPQQWAAADLRRFMWTFGLLSTGFDLLTFALLHGLLHTTPAQFQTAWFITSLLTEIAILLLLRHAGPTWRSPPTPAMGWTCVGAALLGLMLIAWPPAATLLGFEWPDGPTWGVVGAVLSGYGCATAALKARLDRHRKGKEPHPATPSTMR